VIVRRERAHPGAQLRFTDSGGLRFQAILTDQTGADIALIERRHRARARAEDQIRCDKDTGLAKLPFREFALNAVWLELFGLAHDLLAWTQALALSGELARCEPKRLRSASCTRPRGWHSPAAAPSCACRPVGHGLLSSPPPSPGWARCPRRPADPAAPPTNLIVPSRCSLQPARKRPSSTFGGHQALPPGRRAQPRDGHTPLPTCSTYSSVLAARSGLVSSPTVALCEQEARVYLIISVCSINQPR
jgi:hypothetical protein